MQASSLAKLELGNQKNGVSNLVLACTDCNRGVNGKFANLPALPLLQRLHERNEYLITSHHPLRETLIVQTGCSTEKRQQFLQQLDLRGLRFTNEEINHNMAGVYEAIKRVIDDR